MENLVIMGGSYPTPIIAAFPEYNFGFNTSIPWVKPHDIEIRGKQEILILI